MNMMITLHDDGKNENGYEKKLEISPEGQQYKKVRLEVVDSEGRGMSVIVLIDDLRKALTAVKSLK